MLYDINKKELLRNIDSLINNIFKSRVFDYYVSKEKFDRFIHEASQLINDIKQLDRNNNTMYFYRKLIKMKN